MRELRAVLRDVDVLKALVVAEDLADIDCPTVSIDDTLDSVLSRLDAGYRDELPVVEGETLRGVVRLEDVLARYRQELKRRQVLAGVGED